MSYVMPDVCESGSDPGLRHTLQSQSPSQALPLAPRGPVLRGAFSCAEYSVTTRPEC